MGGCVLCYVIYRLSPLTQPLLLCVISDCCLFLDSELASVITARTTYGVIYVPLAAVGANCQCRSYCLIVSSSLGSSCL